MSISILELEVVKFEINKIIKSKIKHEKKNKKRRGFTFEIEFQEFVLGLLMKVDLDTFTLNHIINEVQLFTNEEHEYIKEAIYFNYSRSKIIDTESTIEALKSMGRLEKCGGEVYLNYLSENVKHKLKNRWVIKMYGSQYILQFKKLLSK